jgi:hypothetical protein
LGGLDKGPLDLSSCGSSAGVHDTSARVSTFTCLRKLAVREPIKFGAEFDESVNPVCPVFDQHSHCIGIAETRSGQQRVSDVFLN